MNEHLKRVWTASAVAESLQGELDGAESDLDETIGDAVKAGMELQQIGEAANLSPAELRERIRRL